MAVCRFLFLLALSTCLLCAIAHTENIFLPSQLDDEHDSLSSSAPSCPAPDPNLYYKPVIGIVSHPGDGASGRLSNATLISNIPASYVKLVESGGARVIPLIYNEDPENLKKKLHLVNGVLFTGGWCRNTVNQTAKEGEWCKTDQYFQTINTVFKHALERNHAGDHFPVYAISLGFQLVSMITSKDPDILENIDASNMLGTLQFSGNIQGSIFESFPPDLVEKLKTDCLFQHNNKWGISPSRFLSNPHLSSFFEILTTSKDRDGKVFVSTASGRNYPVTIFLWHPQKNPFEWATSGNQPHTEDAIRVTQSVANFLVSESRKSSNRPDAQEVRDNLIYNFPPIFGGYAGKGYDQVYHFFP